VFALQLVTKKFQLSPSSDAATFIRYHNKVILVVLVLNTMFNAEPIV
jgi:hypothetical protein